MRRGHKLTPHQRIVRASKRNTGCYLTAEDCHALSFDDAIITAARNDDEKKKRHAPPAVGGKEG